MKKLEPNLLFNPIIDTDLRIIGGKNNGIANLTLNKYPWSKKLWDAMNANFWLPSEVALIQDAKDYKNLNPEEQRAFDLQLSFLVFLDSMVTNALPYLSNYITAPEIQLLLNNHSFQESIHSQSYAQMLESCVSAPKRKKIYDLACSDEKMKNRNQYIAQFHQNFIDNPTDDNFLKVIMGQYLLEGVYFFAGFAFFLTLAHKHHKLAGVGQIIFYIQRDERLHGAIFGNLYKELQKENPELFTENMIEEFYTMTKTAVEHEIEWFQYVCGDNIEGLTVDTIDKYIKFLSNGRMKSLGLKELYPNIKKNPLQFLDKMANPNSVKVDFFETKPINYAKSGKELNLDGLDNMEL